MIVSVIVIIIISYHWEVCICCQNVPLLLSFELTYEFISV